MLKYLKAAFFYNPPVPGFGRLPLNILALTGIAILGLGHAAIWLLGMGIEAAYLFMLSSDKRFQRLIEAEDEAKIIEQAESRRQDLVKRLTPAGRQRMDAQEAKCRRILEMYKEGELPAYTVENNADALRKLSWTYLKLLLAQHTIMSVDNKGLEAELRKQIGAVEQELKSENDIPESTRQSKEATLAILRKRYGKVGQREQTLKEIDSDLTRIEAQLDLALDNAVVQEREYSVSANIDFASHLLDDSAYGETGAAVADLEQTYTLLHENKPKEKAKARLAAP